MRSASNARLLIWGALVVLIAGCARVDVNSPQIRGIAYFRIEDVVKHHPLYGQLSQMDDAIAAIDLEAAGPHVPLSGAQIAAETKELNLELAQAGSRANKTIALKQKEYAQREQQAIAAALAAAGIKPGASAGAQMTATSAQQVQAAAAAANNDFAAYQRSVVAQDNAASNAIASQLQAQANQKLRAREMEYQQDETDLSLRLTQQDSAQRSADQLRLNNLAMDDATRKQLADQMAAMDAAQARQVNALRTEHARELAAYQEQLRAQMIGQIRRQTGSIAAQSRAKLQSRRSSVSAALRGMGPAALPSALPAGVQAKIAAIHRQISAQFNAEAEKTVDEYNATKADLTIQFQALHGADAGATGVAATEVASLQRRRDQLADRMADQITREAKRLSKERGFSLTIVDVKGAPGGYDLTNDLINDIESLHE